ncbi:aminotransferase class I/II-fold pyridoxal phosphate-dependent enzyme [Bilophila wadsworthia]|uniref:aminotransferase class I/II-fold pyridoxal phosphate-dependent enzyme n=1 Tax=Bilophila wadsworthia TaxID=35833 RepID=UPI0026751645|nr:pyridoxal phosphate-dependent aminotransferase family protein [Bilophila wadsworthia]
MADAKRTLRECLDERLKEGRARGLERRPPLLDMAGEGPVVHMGGRAFLNFTLNDGLGLASSAEWRAEVGECFAAFPPSASASRLAGGRSRITEEAEQAVAAYFGFDECLFLPSGYQGNLACAMALIHAGQPVFVDRRVHASIARGILLGKADVRTYAHADYGHLERRLASAPPAAVQPLVMTESLFSMDGTELDVSRMAELRSKYGFFLMVDEAHAVGALGPGGRGLCAGVPGTADIVLGTFGKSLGLFGSFLLLPKGFAAFFESLSSAVMHSTAMPPAHAAAVLKLLERLPLLEAERARLRDNAVFFRARLSELGIPTRGTAHIVAVPTGGEVRTTHLGEQLAERGVLALAARYPTVPYGDGLLRFGLTALHTHGMLERTARLLADLWG